MAREVKVAMIGLDTSHSIELTRLLQAPDRPQAVDGARVLRCMRFETPFQNREGLDGRQKQLEQWGVKVSETFDETVKDCDAIMLEINDPSLHVEYFRRCAGMGKPIFLDKPLADTMPHGEQILEEGRKHGTRYFSASSLRFVPQLEEACQKVPQPSICSVYGPLGKAPAGSSIVWYGVHAVEMLQRAMGGGARSVTTTRDGCGAVLVVGYRDGRRGVVELTDGAWIYGGVLRTPQEARPFVADIGRIYADLLTRIVAFFQGGAQPVALEATREVMAILDAAERSLASGRQESTGL